MLLLFQDLYVLVYPSTTTEEVQKAFWALRAMPNAARMVGKGGTGEP